MAFEEILVTEPIECRAAFEGDDERSLLSQAAFLLAMGSLLHPEWSKAIWAEEEELLQLRLPEIEPISQRYEFWEIHEFGLERFGLDVRGVSPERTYWRDYAMKIVHSLYEAPDPRLPALALAWSIRAPEEIVRVCSAISQVDHFRYIGLALEVLFRAVRSTSPLVAELAVTCLSRLFGQDAKPQLQEPPKPPTAPSAVQTPGCILVHGTVFGLSIASSVDKWWWPGEYFHTYLHGGKRPDLYAGSQPFEWEGGFSGHAHQVAARNLTAWQQRHGWEWMDVITHSHGGNMTMLASHMGTKVDKLVLLSCPVHWNLRQPNWPNVRSTQSIRIKFDLVIFADRGDQRFPPGTIPEHVLPLWFLRHGTTHKPETWLAENLDRFV